MIRSSRNRIPLLQQRLRIPQLLPNRNRTITPQRNPNRNLLPLRLSLLRQYIDQNPTPLHHIPNLLIIRSIERGARLADGGIIVHLDALRAQHFGAVVEEAGAEVAWLDDGDGDAQGRQLAAHRLADARARPLRARVQRVARAAVPGADAAEVGDGAVAWGEAEVGEEGLGDVEHAEDVGVEGVVVFFGSGGGGGC